MEELSLHILDIAFNSIEAGATEIHITVEHISKESLLRITIKDNGRGVPPEALKHLGDPFYSTKGKKTGLGIPLLAQAAMQTGGDVIIHSTPDKGTSVIATFKTDHIDLQPIGDLPSTIAALITASPDIDIFFTYRIDENTYSFNTRELRRHLEDVPLNHPEIWYLIKEELQESIKGIQKGGHNNVKEGTGD